MAANPPISTVYVRNLEERVKPEALKEVLATIFSDYGTIVDIVAKTNLRAKGQAFVVFDDPDSAQRAVDEVQGFELFDRPMHLAIARTRSDATVRAAGSGEEFEAHKRRRVAEMDKKKALEAATAAQNKQAAGARGGKPAAGVFGRFPGFREVRLVPGRRGLAFVEYETEAGAIAAKESTAGMALGDEGKPVKVTYQRQ
ncbi:small nuclear ribonucleoprotein [Gaeumannomyces tritici R3-111a-1]|uniref:Small nuclear ribonucleoprotein n=1 Tax=Gaeumannomyces tritici (strain R3-111a-1) TaxID=644352 RepID=J3P5N9_GAET3|nr:small nuclear ribonucleoprotein [Gaeumannomyces tritici R3-111a-1]EJT74991.1 small nuclear ribonucleoprotein [Gaeumannomyces tritici R3-111a-1]